MAKVHGWKETWLDIQEKSTDLCTPPENFRYVFRGENQDIYNMSQSNLWRRNPHWTFAAVWKEQIERLEYAVNFDRERGNLFETSPPELKHDGTFGVMLQADRAVRDLLMDIQHMGGSTLLLDVTVDLNVALFFACILTKYQANKGGGLPDGYVKVFKVPKKYLWEPKPSNRRALVQKGLHVLPCSQHGIKEVEKWTVRGAHKEGILEYLAHHYRVHDATMFPDVEGYIAFQEFIDAQYPYPRRVLTVRTDSDGNITTLCGKWGQLVLSEVIREIETEVHHYYVEDNRGRIAGLHVKGDATGKCLKQDPNSDCTDNLYKLPRS